MFAVRMHVKPLSPFQFKRRENPLFKYRCTLIGECNTMETIRSWQGPEGECYCCGRCPTGWASDFNLEAWLLRRFSNRRCTEHTNQACFEGLWWKSVLSFAGRNSRSADVFVRWRKRVVRGAMVRALCGISRRLELLGRINGCFVIRRSAEPRVAVTYLGEIIYREEISNLKPTKSRWNGQNTAHKHWQDTEETK